MIIHLFWFRLADDEQDWGTSWPIQLKLAENVLSTLCRFFVVHMPSTKTVDEQSRAL